LKWGRALTNTPRSSGPANVVHFKGRVEDPPSEVLRIGSHQSPLAEICSPNGPPSNRSALQQWRPDGPVWTTREWVIMPAVQFVQDATAPGSSHK
jgi:hypothetical protein